MTDSSSVKTTPVRLSAKQAAAGADGVAEQAAVDTEPATDRAPVATPGSAPKPAAAPRPAAKPATAARPVAATGPRRVRLSISRVDPWSVMKLGFLLSVALGIMTVVETVMT